MELFSIRIQRTFQLVSTLEDRISNIFEELNITNPKIKEAIRKSLIGIPIKNNNAQLKELIQVFLNTIDNEDYFA